MKQLRFVKLTAHRAGLPGHTVANRMRANEISFFIGPLDSLGLSTHWASRPIGPPDHAYKAGLAGDVPIKHEA